MKRIFIVVLVCVFSCNKNQPITFLGKDASKQEVWKEMLQQKEINFLDVKRAYRTYKKHNGVTRSDHKIFERWENLNSSNLDAKGYLIDTKKALQEIYRASPREYMTNTTSSFFAKNGDQIAYSVPNSGSKGNWISIGPFGDPDVHRSAKGNGATEEIIFHPTDPAIMYLPNRNGGLWKTINYGKNWTCLTDHFDNTGASCAAISISNPNIIYFGTFASQLWKSTDAGVNWTNINTGQTGYSTSLLDIEVHPTDPDKIVVANRLGGLSYSHDGGTTWTQSFEGNFQEVIMSKDGGLLYAHNRVAWQFTTNAAIPTILKSTDFGLTWTSHEVTKDIAKCDFLHMALHEEEGTTNKTLFVYGIAQAENTKYPTRFAGLWKSEDNATTFTRLKNDAYAYPNGPVPLRMTDGVLSEYTDYYGGVNPLDRTSWASGFYVSPLNKNNMITMAEKMHGSQDGGNTWEFKPSYGGSNWADMRYMDLNITRDTIYFCNDGGLWTIAHDDLFVKDEDIPAGKTRIEFMNSKVISKNGDISIQEATQMDVSLVNKDVFITGGQDIGQVFIRNGRETHAASADVYRGRMNPVNDAQFIVGKLKIEIGGEVKLVDNDMQADHFNPLRIYGFTTTEKGAIPKLVRSKNGINAWDTKYFIDETEANGGGSTSYSSHPTDWELVDLSTTTIERHEAGTFVQSRANKELAFIGDEKNKKAFITTNLSADKPLWIAMENTPESGLYRFATHPKNENLIALATESAVFLSRDKGVSWSSVGHLPITNPKFILFDKNTSEGLYVCNNATVVYSDETLDDWIFFNKGLPNLNMKDMRIVHYPNNDNQLYVTKYGRGAFRSTLYSQMEKRLPVSNFSIHGNSKSNITAGESVQLFDLSSDANSISWTLTNGTTVIQKGNEATPVITLVDSGTYTVTQTATNDSGSVSSIKEAYIVVDDLHNFCVGKSGSNFSYRRISQLTFSGEDPMDFNSQIYRDTNKVIKFKEGEEKTLNIKLTNTATSFHLKAWVDFNNDGIIDEVNETVFNSNGRVKNNFDTSFGIPSSAVKNKKLKFRIVGLSLNEEPVFCPDPNFGTHQIIDMSISFEADTTFENTVANLVNHSTINVSSTYSNATEIYKRGFVYSKYESNPTIETAERTTETTTAVNENFTNELKNLDNNSSYYYRAYIIGAAGVIYDNDVNTFTTSTFNMPLLSSNSVKNLGNGEWEFISTVIAEGNTFDTLIIEYGAETSYDQSEEVDVNLVAQNEAYPLTFKTNLDSANPFYTFRLKGTLNGKTYYSKALQAKLNQQICTPTINSSVWYKRFDKFTFDTVSVSGNSNNYQDMSNNVAEVEVGKTYTYSVKDSRLDFNEPYALYLDMNNDKDFDDPGELIKNIPAQESYEGEFTIPENIVLDTNLRMRAVLYYGSNSLPPCTLNNGQVIDISIKVKQDETLSTKDNTLDQNEFVIYPNPVSEVLHIHLADFVKVKKIDIYTIAGKKTFPISETKREISVGNLPNGIYLLSITDQSNVTNIRKFVKN